MNGVAPLLRSLAGSVRAGLPVRTALQRAHLDYRGPMNVELERLARRLELGESLTSAVRSFERSCSPEVALADALDLAVATGGDLPGMLEHIADMIEERERAQRLAAAHSAGVTISARMVAALPVAFIPLSPLRRASMFDPAGIVMLFVGLSLAGLGMWWIGRLAPRWAPPEAGRRIAMLLSAAVCGGASVEQALRHHAPRSEELAAAWRRVRLGLSWSAALARSDDASLRALGEVLQVSWRTGTPVVEALRRFEADRAERELHRIEAEVRRAPVKMIVPLAVCILPAFGILGAGPFLRGLLG